MPAKIFSKPFLLINTILVVLILSGIYFLFQAPSNVRIEKQLAECSKLPSSGQSECFRRVIESFFQKKGSRETLKELSAIKAALTPEAIDCHIFAHYTGNAAYRKFKTLEGTRASAENMAGVCAGGFEHGLLQAYFKNRATAIPDMMRESCAEYWEGANNTVSYGCFHGIGHALMFYLGNDIPASLAGCSKLPQNWQKDGCSLGVFMEYLYSYRKNYDHPKPALVENMSDLCSIVDSFWKKRCLAFVGIAAVNRELAKNTHPTFGTAFNECNQISEEESRLSCYDYTAFFIGSRITDAGDLEKVCLDVDSRYIFRCKTRSTVAFFRYNSNPDITPDAYCDFFNDQSQKVFCKEYIIDDVWLNARFE